MLHKILTVLLADYLYYLHSLHALMEQPACWRGVHSKELREDLANSKEETNSLSSKLCEEPSHTNKYINLELGPSLVKPSYETPAMGDALIAALWETQVSLTHIPNSETLRW